MAIRTRAREEGPLPRRPGPSLAHRVVAVLLAVQLALPAWAQTGPGVAFLSPPSLPSNLPATLPGGLPLPSLPQSAQQDILQRILDAGSGRPMVSPAPAPAYTPAPQAAPPPSQPEEAASPAEAFFAARGAGLACQPVRVNNRGQD